MSTKIILPPGIPSNLYWRTCASTNKTYNVAEIVQFIAIGQLDENTYVIKSSDSGTTWVNITSSLPQTPIGTIYSIDVDNTGQFILFGCGINIFLSQDYGTSWIVSTLISDLIGVTSIIGGVAIGTIYIDTTRYMYANVTTSDLRTIIYRTQTNGVIWEQVYNPTSTPYLPFSSSTIGYISASADSGYVYFTGNGILNVSQKSGLEVIYQELPKNNFPEVTVNTDNIGQYVILGFGSLNFGDRQTVTYISTNEGGVGDWKIASYSVGGHVKKTVYPLTFGETPPLGVMSKDTRYISTCSSLTINDTTSDIDVCYNQDYEMFDNISDQGVVDSPKRWTCLSISNSIANKSTSILLAGTADGELYTIRMK